MKCPHCHRDINAKPDRSLWELAYMIGKGWLFSGTLPDDKWKTDPDLVLWLQKGWVEMCPGLGFRITPLGIQACKQNVQP